MSSLPSLSLSAAQSPALKSSTPGPSWGASREQTAWGLRERRRGGSAAVLEAGAPGVEKNGTHPGPGGDLMTRTRAPGPGHSNLAASERPE